MNPKFRGDAVDMILWILEGALFATVAWLVYIYYRFGWGPDSPVFR